jgi:hypothetical protein
MVLRWLLFGRGSLLGEQDSMNVGKNSSRGNGDTSEELVQLFVVLDSQRDVTGNDATLFVVASGVASQLQDFSRKVLEHGSEVNGCTGSHAGRVLALTEVTSDTTNRELKTSLCR